MILCSEHCQPSATGPECFLCRHRWNTDTAAAAKVQLSLWGLVYPLHFSSFLVYLPPPPSPPRHHHVVARIASKPLLCSGGLKREDSKVTAGWKPIQLQTRRIWDMSCRERANHHRSAERSLSYVFEGVTFRSCSLCIKNMANKLNITVLYIEIIFFLGGGEWAFLIEDMIPDLFLFLVQPLRFLLFPGETAKLLTRTRSRKLWRQRATERDERRRLSSYHCETGSLRDKKNPPANFIPNLHENYY